MRAIVTVLGKDQVGIIARISGALAAHKVNILDLSQTVMQDYFTMIMLVDLAEMSVSFQELNDMLAATGKALGMQILVQREDIFQAMHHI